MVSKARPNPSPGPPAAAPLNMWGMFSHAKRSQSFIASYSSVLQPKKRSVRGGSQLALPGLRSNSIMNDLNCQVRIVLRILNGENQQARQIVRQRHAAKEK